MNHLTAVPEYPCAKPLSSPRERNSWQPTPPRSRVPATSCKNRRRSTVCPCGEAGSSWILTSYNDGTGGVVSVLADTNVSTTFAESGDLAGSAGCNSFWGTYTTDGDELSIVSLDSTNLSCAEPAGDGALVASYEA